MIIYTMGFSKKTAREFFSRIAENDIDVLIDVRINNKSQLAGFAKAVDLEFFLEKISHVPYVYEPRFAPTKELLKDWRDGSISWDEYQKIFTEIMDSREVERVFKELFSNYSRPLLLCSEATPEHCHRRLLAERFASVLGSGVVTNIEHL